MKIETFFEKFEQLTDAPNAIAKLRDLVLELAVSGRLVSISPAIDESTPKTPFDETPFNIPISWRWLQLGALAQFINGDRGKNYPSKSVRVDRGVPFINAGHLVNGSVSLEDMDYIPDERFELLGSGKTKPGDVIYCLRGSLGKAAVVENIECGAIASSLLILRPSEQVLARFLYMYLISPFGRWMIKKYDNGSAQPNLSATNVKRFLVPLPRIIDQKRIVAKVDELMALCDRLEAQLQERDTQQAALARAALARFAEEPTPANLNLLFHDAYNIEPTDLRKAILTIAVQGKLVPQDPNDEPASELFSRIQMELAQKKAEGFYGKSMALPPIGEEERPFSLPCGWEWFRLRILVFALGDGLHGTPEYSEDTDFYFINGNNLANGRIVIKPHTKTVSFEEFQKYRKQMTPNTVLVSINGTLGSVAFYENENVVLGKSACYFNLSNLVDKHFIRAVIESPYFINYAIENATGTIIRNLGLKAMNYFPVPLPPLAEQRRIVSKVDQLMILVDQLEAQLITSREIAGSLMNAAGAELSAGA